MRIALIPGDGIGPEVVAEAVKVLDAVTDVETTEYDLGARHWLATGETLPDGMLDALRAYDAILLGAVGDPAVPPGVLERGLLLALRFGLDHHVNLRPVARGGVDLVVVREGTEGPYAGAGGTLRAGTPYEVATEESINTRYGVERVVRDAFRRAAARRGHLTLVHKTNVLLYAGGLWQRTFDDVAAEHPDVATAYCHVDAACLYLVEDPGRFDVVVTDNLFGDILTDLGAAISGGIGLAASGNIDTTRANPAMFEPVHGSAPDIAGTGTADPVAAIRSAALLLDHLGETAAAQRVSAAVESWLRERPAGVPTKVAGDEIVSRL
jgi:3-isopropylmalate dehydrogenase